MKWFSKKTLREVDPWREFYEELVATGYLDPKKFKYLHYELVGQHIQSIYYDKRDKIDTFKYADIYIPKYINYEQENEIKNLKFKTCDEYIWVTKDEIDNLKTKDGKIIAEHTHKIFHTQKFQQ